MVPTGELTCKDNQPTGEQTGGANLSRADLRKAANLIGSLREVNLKEANLHWAKLVGANLSWNSKRAQKSAKESSMLLPTGQTYRGKSITAYLH